MNRPEEALGVPGEGRSTSPSTKVKDYTEEVPAVAEHQDVPSGVEDISILIEDEPSQPVDPTDPDPALIVNLNEQEPSPSPSEPMDKPPEPTDGFDRSKEAHEALDRVRELLESSTELSQLNEATRLSVKALIDNLQSQLDKLAQSGANASTNQVLVVVLAWSEAEDELASRAQSSDSDEKILKAIERKFLRARPAFWTALESARLKSGQYTLILVPVSSL